MICRRPIIEKRAKTGDTGDPLGESDDPIISPKFANFSHDRQE
jgi:hypothetical protein